MSCEIKNQTNNQNLLTSNEERIKKDEEFALSLLKQEQDELERRDELFANQLASMLPTIVNIRNLRNGENEEEEEDREYGEIYREASSDNEDDDEDEMEIIIPPGNRVNLPHGFVVSSLPTLFSLLSRGLSPDNIIQISSFEHPDLYEQLSNLPNVPTPAKNKDQLPVKEVKSNEEIEKGTVCSICLCDYEKGNWIKTLPCTHYFHVECIDKWLGSNNKCPICKRYVDEDEKK